MKSFILFLISALVGVAFFTFDKSTANQTKAEPVKPDHEVDVNGARHCVICRAGVYSPREGNIRRCSFCDKPEPKE